MEETGAGAATAAQLFALLWTELVDVLGTAAAATLVRRAAKRGCTRLPELADLRVVRQGWEYHYTLPAGWERSAAAEIPEFAELLSAELAPLLREFTGDIVLKRLARVPGLGDLDAGRAEET
ncbi:MAG: hypothetical protein HYV09_20665 [Deltaproteobacteria bacterium]|nr:hypothetical protein [Deltaproteobacteria bacterium]